MMIKYAWSCFCQHHGQDTKCGLFKKKHTHTSHTRKDDGALTQKCLLIFNCDCECDRAEFLVVRRQFIKSTISSNATTNNYYYYYKQEIQISSWLRQELKKSQCGFVCPVLVCLKLSIFIFSAQIHLEDFRMTSGWLTRLSRTAPNEKKIPQPSF